MSETSKAFRDLEIQKRVQAESDDALELNNAIRAERERSPQWKNLRNGPDGAEYQDLERKKAQVISQAGGIYALCDDQDTACNVLLPLQNRMMDLEHDYFCADPPSLPLVRSLLQDADAWIRGWLPVIKKQDHIVQQQTALEWAREKMNRIREMVLQLCGNNPALPPPPPVLDDPGSELLALKQWHMAATLHLAGTEWIKRSDAARRLGVGPAEITRMVDHFPDLAQTSKRGSSVNFNALRDKIEQRRSASLRDEGIRRRADQRTNKDAWQAEQKMAAPEATRSIHPK